MDAGYTIMRAQPEHLSLLPDIERQAATVLDTWDIPPTVLADTTPLPTFAAAQHAGLLWVVLSPHQQPVGFALLEHEGSGLHLEEIDIHPLHGRRGIGRVLTETICAWARGHGFREMTLTTYRKIPWNTP